MKHYYVITFQATVDHLNVETGTTGTSSPVLNPKPNVAQKTIENYYLKKRGATHVAVVILSHPNVTAADYHEAAKNFIKL
jgi:hypothetical protein